MVTTNGNDLLENEIGVIDAPASCQRTLHQRAKDIPAGHPAHVYLNEARLDAALVPFLATALFGPGRTDYWRLPILATSLDAAPQGELQALFDALQLDVVYQPADSAVDVAANLYDLSSETAQSAARESAEDWSAHPASHNANLEPVVEGPAISLAARHTKVRRAGYSI